MSLLSVVPKLVSDVNLKRARVETEEGDAIRVTGINCGDRVTIVPTVTEGTKIADFTINNVDGELYAPKGGVGEAYPESTGGEIFNCYEGTDRNVASGNYSKASGTANQALGDNTVVGGSNNTANHFGNAIFGAFNVGRGDCTFIAGYGNTVNSSVGEFDKASIVLGTDNMNVNGCVIGNANGTQGNATYKMGYLFGKNLGYWNNKDDSDNSPETLVIGNWNTKTTLISPSVVLACGSMGNRFNGLELSRTDCKILTDLQLSTDTTAVNAITAAQDPLNVTADDKTLVTKSYISSYDGHSKTYWPVSEQSLTANTNYSIGTLVGDNSWTFPYSSGSMVFALYVNGIEYRATLILPPYLDSSMTPQLKVPITACYTYNNGDNGRIDGVLLIYNTSTKEISFENPEGIEFDNPGDTLTSAYNWGNIDIWFVGLSCFDHI